MEEKINDFIKDLTNNFAGSPISSKTLYQIENDIIDFIESQKNYDVKSADVSLGDNGELNIDMHIVPNSGVQFVDISFVVDPPNPEITDVKKAWKILMIPLSDTWRDCEFSGVLCPKCNYTMLYKKSYFIVSDQYGCPRCGHTEGGEY